MQLNPSILRKRISTIFISLAVLSSLEVFAQAPAPSRGNPATAPPSQAAAVSDDLSRFDLDFKGGPPRQLVAEIEKVGVPINVIIPDGANTVNIPPLKMRNVTLPQLFQALEVASQNAPQKGAGGVNPYMMDPRMLERYFGVKVTPSATNSFSLSPAEHYGFRTEGPPANDSIWYFFHESLTAPQQQRICRFYQLEPYLSKYTIEDITTAVETGWKMLGVKNAGQLNFHKETKLLIAVGEAQNMSMIDEVLAQLEKGMNPEPHVFQPEKPSVPSETQPASKF